MCVSAGVLGLDSSTIKEKKKWSKVCVFVSTCVSMPYMYMLSFFVVSINAYNHSKKNT